MSTTVYNPQGQEIKVPDGKVGYFKSIGYTMEKPGGKRSRKKPVATEAPDDGEDKG